MQPLCVIKLNIKLYIKLNDQASNLNISASYRLTQKEVQNLHIM